MKINTKALAYIWQPAVAGIYTFVVFIMIRFSGHSTELDAVAMCSFVATVFILFTFPQAPVASLRVVLGGYALSMLSGAVCYFLIQWLKLMHVGISFEMLNILLGSFAVALGMVVMIGFKLRHPPALGLALGVAIIPWDARGLIIIIIAIVLVAILKRILYPYLHNL